MLAFAFSKIIINTKIKVFINKCLIEKSCSMEYEMIPVIFSVCTEATLTWSQKTFLYSKHFNPTI